MSSWITGANKNVSAIDAISYCLSMWRAYISATKWQKHGKTLVPCLWVIKPCLSCRRKIRSVMTLTLLKLCLWRSWYYLCSSNEKVVFTRCMTDRCNWFYLQWYLIVLHDVIVDHQTMAARFPPWNYSSYTFLLGLNNMSSKQVWCEKGIYL